MVQIEPGSVATVGHVAEIIHTAVAPVFLLAGIGGFLNVCALRMARIVDRARALEPELLASRAGEHERLLGELRVLDRRIAIVNWAIFFTVLSAGLICTVVVLLFADPFTDTPLARPSPSCSWRRSSPSASASSSSWLKPGSPRARRASGRKCWSIRRIRSRPAHPRQGRPALLSAAPSQE